MTYGVVGCNLVVFHSFFSWLYHYETKSRFHDCYYPLKPHVRLSCFLLTLVSPVETKDDDVLSGVNSLVPALAF